jgi:CheY-like chemotaxis protein
MLKMLLMKKNIKSDLAFNGQEAVDAVKKAGIDHYGVIFMDYTMPVKVPVVGSTCSM